MTPPRPPADLDARTPLTVTLPPGTALHRFYPAGREPIYFDTSPMGRLNAPDGRYGVLYAAARPEGAFAETFLRNPGRTLLAPELIAAKGQARVDADVEDALLAVAARTPRGLKNTAQWGGTAGQCSWPGGTGSERYTQTSSQVTWSAASSARGTVLRRVLPQRKTARSGGLDGPRGRTDLTRLAALPQCHRLVLTP